MSVGSARLREDSDAIRKGAIAKGEDPGLIDQALVIDEQRRDLLGKADHMRNQKKQLSESIGLAIKDVESVQAASFIWLFPLTFASSAFVPVETMPDWLAWFARNNPVTHAVNGTRYLILGEPWGFPADVMKALVWIVILLGVFIPFAISRYRRAV